MLTQHLRLQNFSARLDIPWPLVKADNHRVLPYQLFEVSKNTIGIITSSNLTVGERVNLLRPGFDELPFEVVMLYGPHNQESRRFRLQLAKPAQDHDCESLVQLRSRVEFGVGRVPNGLQRTRFSLDPLIASSCRTFGSAMWYKFDISNISKSGLHLIPRRGSDAPFQIYTLLEISVFIPSHKPIELVGRTVRFDPKDGVGMGYGVSLSDQGSPGYQQFLALVDNIGSEIVKAA